MGLINILKNIIGIQPAALPQKERHLKNHSQTSPIEEPFFIPYSLTDIPDGPYLVFSPHYDDETLGMGGTIRLASDKGIEVIVIFVTDGSAGGNPKKRIKEAECASSILRINSIEHWAIKDREVFFNRDLIWSKTEKILRIKTFKTLFLPSFQEFHPDHRYLTLYVLDFLKTYSPSQAVWLYEISRHGEANALIDITDVIEDKERAIDCYLSQLDQNAYKDLSFAINRARGFSVYEKGAGYCEAFFKGRASRISTEYYNKINIYNIIDAPQKS